jgi:hypothetical protein
MEEDRKRAAAQIGQTAKQLHFQAEQHDLDFLAHLISMVILEADQYQSEPGRV